MGASLFIVAAFVLSGSVVPGASADPHPSIDAVQRRVDDLQRQAEQASERFNTIRARLGDSRQQLRALDADVASQVADTEQLRLQVEQLVMAQVDGSGLDTTSQLLVSDDPDDFIASMAAMRSYSDQTADLLVSYENARHELALRRQRAQDQLDQISDATSQMADQKAMIAQKADAAEALLTRLKAAALARAQARASRSEARPPVTGSTGSTGSGDGTGGSGSTGSPATVPTGAPASGAAAVAVETALAQVGDPYVYGAAGPDAFDCSGLTMYAYAAAGVALSHSSSIQSGQGVPVSVSDVQPGDLVFYYSPVSHVGMYIGNGMIVHAPHPGESVQVVPMDEMPVAWIRRVG